MSVPGAALPAYQAGDLSKLLNPTAPPPPVVEGKADPSFFGYLKPVKGRPASRKAPKGGGKFSQANLNAKIKAKKQLQAKVRAGHERQVQADKERKQAAKDARNKANASDENGAEDDDEEEDGGIDTDDSDIGDEIDEAAIDDFMRDIEAEDAAGAEEDADSDAEDAPVDPEAIAAKAKQDRLAKKEKRLAEDAEMEAPLPKKKDIKKQRVRQRTEAHAERTEWMSTCG